MICVWKKGDDRNKGHSNFLLQVRYNNGNYIDCSSGAVFAGWRGLGIFSLARLADHKCTDDHAAGIVFVVFDSVDNASTPL
jgi:hypothetical protein